MIRIKTKLIKSNALILTGILLSGGLSLAAMADNTALDKALTDNKALVAEKMYQNLDKAYQDSLAGKVLYARLLFRLGETEDSYDLLEQLKQDNQDNVDLVYYFGRSAIVMAQKASIFSKLSYASDALEAWQHALALDKEHVKTLSGLINFHIGAPSIAGGDIEQALIYSNTLIGLNSELGYADLARVYWKKERNSLAEQAIKDGLAITPESERLYFTQGLAYIQQAEDDNKLWAKARLSFNSAVSYAKSSQEKQRSLYQLGKISVESGEEITEGIKALTLLLNLEGDEFNEWGRYRLAQLYLTNEQPTKAQEFIALVDYQDDDDLESEVKKLTKKVKKAIKNQGKAS